MGRPDRASGRRRISPIDDELAAAHDAGLHRRAAYGDRSGHCVAFKGRPGDAGASSMTVVIVHFAQWGADAGGATGSTMPPRPSTIVTWSSGAVGAAGPTTLETPTRTAAAESRMSATRRIVLPIMAGRHPHRQRGRACGSGRSRHVPQAGRVTVRRIVVQHGRRQPHAQIPGGHIHAVDREAVPHVARPGACRDRPRVPARRGRGRHRRPRT